MAVHGGPDIVTDGLVLCLDAADKNSYPGSGTTWTDLANGISFTCPNTLTPFSNVSGAPALSFNGSGYWHSTGGTSQSDKVNIAGDTTVILWLYCYDLATRKTVFEKAGNTYSSYEQEIAVTWETSEVLSWYSRYNSYGYGDTSALDIGKWNMMAIKMSTGEGVTARTGFYSKNGSDWTSSWTSNSSTAITKAGDIRIGTGYAGTVDDGAVGAVHCYNKMLTDTEISQNYNAQRSRFGL